MYDIIKASNEEKQIFFNYDDDLKILENSIKFICLNDVGRE